MAQSLKEFLDEKLKANSLRAPDRNPLVAPQADLAKKVKALLNKYETKKVGKIDSPWNKYASGMSIGDLLFGESPELLDDMSYGMNPLTSGGKTGRIPIPDKRLLDMPVPIPATGGLGVIKNKGGNWLTGSVENALKGLKPYAPGPDPRYTGYDAEHAVNSWIDNTLTKYIKNRMATPSDEVRKLADQGILHYTPREMSQGIRNDVITARKKAGFPIDGMADNHVTGTAWEDLADSLVMSDPAGELVKDNAAMIATGGAPSPIFERNPWLSKLAPDEPVYDIANYSGGMNELAGYDHLIDELLNATNPESKFPQHLRMKPEGFKGLTMEEAVKKVHGINQHRALQAEAARKQMSRAEGIPTTKTYDDGFRFVAPENTKINTEHHDYVVDAGKRGVWCTQGACDTYAGGDSRVEILLDDFGNPHAQIQIKTDKPKFGDFTLDEWNSLTGAVEDHAGGLFGSKLVNKNDPDSIYNYAMANDLIPKEKFKQSIAQIKPIGNSWDHKKVQELMAKDPNYKAKIQEKLQDFVRSGNWSDVGDLHNTGLKDILKSSGRTQSDNDELLNVIGSRFATNDQITKGMEQVRKLRIKKMFDEQD